MTLLPLLTLATRMAWMLGIAAPPADILTAISKHAQSEYETALAVEWAWNESRFNNAPRAWSGDAKSGLAQCFLQVHSRTPLTLDECAERWYGALHEGTRMCGSVEGGLRMLSSGRCNGANRLVSERVEDALLMLELAR